jgi:hypothetical protein
VENQDLAAKPRVKQRARKSRAKRFAEFDRSFFMFLSTDTGFKIWNRSRSMLSNGHLPSATALHLYEHFGIKLSGSQADEPDHDRDRRAIEYFARLPIPSDAIAPPSIFDPCGGEA